MKTIEHLTEQQMMAYAGETLEQTQKLEVGRHLLQCDMCRSRMPAPTPERFVAALMSENDSASAFLVEKTVVSGNQGHSSYLSVFQTPSTFAWGAGALVLLLSFTAFLWFYAGRQPIANGEVAQTTPAEKEVMNQPNLMPSPDRAGNPRVNNSDHSDKLINIDKPSISSHRAEQGGNKVELKNNGQNIRPGVGLNEKSDRSASAPKSDSGKIIVSNSRSLNDRPEGAPEIVLSPYFETVTEKQPVLRWKTVPGAVQYELYVSDSEQTLVEKGEVSGGGGANSYKLKTGLEINKSYKWKIIAILPDNKRLSSDSINFSVGGTIRKYSSKKIGQMKINPTRCVQETTKAEP